MGAQQGRNEVKFLGSLVLLVSALAVFVALLIYFAPEDERPIEPTLASEETQLLRKKTRSRPLRDDTDEEQTTAAKEDTDAVADVADSAPSETEVKPDNEDLEKAIELVDSGNPDDALVLLQQILSKDPKNERALIEVSMIHLIDYKDAAAAVPWLERSLRSNPSNRLVLAELAAIYGEQGNVEAGVKFFQDMQKGASRKDAANFSLGIGQLLMHDGRGDEAIMHFENAAEQQPNNPLILSSLANTYSRRGNSDKAIATYRKSVAAHEASLDKLPADDKSRPNRRAILLRTRLEVVNEFYKRGDFDVALEELDKVSKHVPNHPLIANWRARIARRAG